MEAAAAPAAALQPASVSSDADEALATDLQTLAAKGAAATHEGAHKVIAAHNPAVAAAEAAAKAQSKKDTEEKKEAYSKRPWSASEDAQLLDTVKKLGVPSVRVDAGSRTEFPQWPDIAKHVAHRTAKQCRERWRHNLDPEIKREPWCEEENQKLLKTYDELGSKWADIARQLPGRTDNACKNQWNKLSGTWKERRDESRLAKNKGQPESPSSLSAALLGLSALDPSTAGQWNDAALLAAATKGSQRAPKRRRQPSERAKPFNDEALRNSGAGQCGRTEGCTRPHGHRGVCKRLKPPKPTRSPRTQTPRTTKGGAAKAAPGAPRAGTHAGPRAKAGGNKAGPGPDERAKRVALQTDLYAYRHTGLQACDPAEYVAQLMLLARTQARAVRARQEAETHGFGGRYFCDEQDPVAWRNNWARHWRSVPNPLGPPPSPRRQEGGQSAAARRAGRRGGARHLPFVAPSVYSAPLRDEELPPSLRIKRQKLR